LALCFRSRSWFRLCCSRWQRVYGGGYRGSRFGRDKALQSQTAAGL